MKTITPASIAWTQDQQPFATDFGDCYFSRQNGLEETRHVFINGNQLFERWRKLEAKQFVIGETGFGTGLNFIAAWKLWIETAPADAQLVFISAELHPLRREDLLRAASLWPELKIFYDQLITSYPILTAGFHTLHFDRVSLLLLLGDATELFAQVEARVDAWFLDGFAPAKNPGLWQPELLNSMARLSKPGSTAATFSAAGALRRNLAAVGFNVEKQKGFGNKRDMTTAYFSDCLNGKTADARITTTPWYRVRNLQAIPSRVTIIGAGIAGCTIANTLAIRGLQVTVIEQNTAAAMEASGNRQAILYSKWGANDDTLSLFNLSAYLHALHFYADITDIHRCGLLHLAWSEEERALQQRLHNFFTHYPDIARIVTQAEASQIAGIEVASGGLFFHQSGWINPASACAQLLQHANITTHFNTALTVLPIDEAVIITTGHLSNQWPPTTGLPLKPLRGQVSHGKPTAVSRQLKIVLSGDGYIAPALGDVQSFGATYTPGITNLAITQKEHTQNCEQLAKSSALLAQQWEDIKTIEGGRTHYRATTPDYLPLCGPVPNRDVFLEDYAALRKDARTVIPLAGVYHPHLYVCSGLGSRGMTYAPLCAEIIASQILQTPAPLPDKLMHALNPARFVIRDLIRNRI